MRKNKKFIQSICLIIVSTLLIVNSALLIIERKTNKLQKQHYDNYAEIATALSKVDRQAEKILLELKEIETINRKNAETVTIEGASEQSAENSVPTSAKFAIGEQVPLPALLTHVKLCTDYRCYNLPYTPHYRLQQVAYTDEYGLRRFNEDYIVGLGAFYSTDIGDRFKVTLDTGREFTIILGDGKAPIDCDDNNMYTPCKNYDGEDCANVLEFIMDDEAMPSEVYAYGSIDCIDEFKGNIIKMVYLGRDNSADWSSYE